MRSEPVYNWVIYDHPADFPNNIVVRRWAISEGPDPVPDDHVHLFDTVEAARLRIMVDNPSADRLPLFDPDPTILEVWM